MLRRQLSNPDSGDKDIQSTSQYDGDANGLSMFMYEVSAYTHNESPDPLFKKADLSRSVVVLGGDIWSGGGGCGAERRRAEASRTEINAQVQICDMIC